jgi:hypothetical protein
MRVDVLDETLGWLWIGLILSGACALMVAVWRWPGGARIRCPGPQFTWRMAVTPWRWATLLFRGSCWYDLSGQIQSNPAPPMTCPECGCQIRTLRTIRLDGPRVAWLRLGSILTLLGISAWTIQWRRSGEWVRTIPTLALAAIEQTHANANSRPLQREVERRIDRSTVAGWSASVLAKGLADDLMNDQRRGNAQRAERLLWALWPESEPALEQMVQGPDVQARILAAAILRQRCLMPSKRLLRACIEELRDDRNIVERYIGRGNSSAAADYLVIWADDAWELLEQAMKSDDMQQRLLAAAVAGHARLVRLIDLAAPILIEHVRENTIRGDAKVAAPALFRFGKDIVPYLQPYVDCEDAQLRATARCILERLEHPERPVHKLRSRLPMLTLTVSDPFTGLSLGECASDLP